MPQFLDSPTSYVPKVFEMIRMLCIVSRSHTQTITPYSHQ